ncbi:hypothetical protein CO151_05530 [bacterium CG_4_9_14_3_um_filter_65_15]|nr:MAG: hypothetical protein CO151_05530 [bacterium CG_4_9_14_3_um_filter_65_15]
MPGRRVARLLVLIGGVALATGCGGGYGNGPAVRDANLHQGASGTAPSGRANRVIGLEFVQAYENLPSAPYFPLTGLAGCAFSPDGTLIICDQKQGKVHGLDPMLHTWFEFELPMARPYAPLDALVDGFKVLVLDPGGGRVYRFDLGGALLDVLVDIDQLDPGYPPQTTAFAMDQDGRMLVTDVGRQQVLLLDSFLNLTLRLGDPGSLGDQFLDPMGLVFRADGSFLVSDQGNRRLALYGRLGFYEQAVGGVFDPDNRFVAPAGLDRDRFGNVFVADPGSGRIHVLDPGLRLLLSAGPDFSLQGAPLAPVDVAVGPGDQLAVSDPARGAVLIYRILYQ